MITIKHGDYTFLAVSINVYHNPEGQTELWASKVDGYNLAIFKGTEAEVTEYRKAIEWAISKGKTLFEV